MAMSSQWDKRHKIDMNSSKKQLLYIWSLVGPTPEGTPLMHSSWWEHPGACAGCCNVESHWLMEGGCVCEWQVASCSEGSPSAKHVRTHSRVDTLQDLLKELIWLRSTNSWRFLLVISGGSQSYRLTISKNDNHGRFCKACCGQHWCLEGWRWDPSAGNRGPQRPGAWKEKVPTAADRIKRKLKYIIKL